MHNENKPRRARRVEEMNVKELLEDEEFKKGGIPNGFIGIDEMVANCLKEKNKTSCKDCKDECLI